MRAQACLFWRTNLFEISATIALFAATVVATVLIGLRFSEIAPSAGCLSLLISGVTAEQTLACPTVPAFVQLQQDVGRPGLLAISVMAVVVAAILGSRILAAEIEARTATLTWSIVRSRRAWLLRRALPPAMFVSLGAVALAIASEDLARAQAPGSSITESFEYAPFLAPVIVARAVAAFAIGLFVGGLAGRVVPALVMSVVLASLIALGSTTASLLPADHVVVDDPGGSRDPAAIYGESMMRANDGRLLTFAEASAEAPPELDLGDRADWVYTNFRPMALVIPGSEAPPAVARDVVQLAGGTLVVLLLTSFALDRRRPY